MKLKQKYFKKFFIWLSILFFFIVLVVILIFYFSNNSTVWKATSVITPIIVIIGITGLSFYIKKGYDHSQEKQNRTSEIQILKDKIYIFQKCYVLFYVLFQNIFYKTKINEVTTNVPLSKWWLQKVIDKLKKLKIELQNSTNNPNKTSKQIWKFKFDLNDYLKLIHNKCKNDSHFNDKIILNIRQKFQLKKQEKHIEAYDHYLLVKKAEEIPFFQNNEFWSFLNRLLNQLNQLMESESFDFEHKIKEIKFDVELTDQFIEKISKIYNLFLFRNLWVLYGRHSLNFIKKTFDPKNEVLKKIIKIINPIWEILHLTWNITIIERYLDNGEKLPEKRNNPDFMNKLDKIYDELDKMMKEISPIFIQAKKWFLEHSDKQLFNERLF